jgi:hypothetical protein
MCYGPAGHHVNWFECIFTLIGLALAARLGEPDRALKARHVVHIGGDRCRLPPSAVSAATSPSHVDREDLGYFAFSNIGFR